MVPRDKPIVCSCCGRETGFTEKGLSMYVIPAGGLQCKHCGHTFIRGREVYLAVGADRPAPWSWS